MKDLTIRYVSFCQSVKFPIFIFRKNVQVFHDVSIFAYDVILEQVWIIFFVYIFKNILFFFFLFSVNCFKDSVIVKYLLKKKKKKLTEAPSDIKKILF